MSQGAAAAAANTAEDIASVCQFPRQVGNDHGAVETTREQALGNLDGEGLRLVVVLSRGCHQTGESDWVWNVVCQDLSGPWGKDVIEVGLGVDDDAVGAVAGGDGGEATGARSLVGWAGGLWCFGVAEGVPAEEDEVVVGHVG